MLSSSGSGGVSCKKGGGGHGNVMKRSLRRVTTSAIATARAHTGSRMVCQWLHDAREKVRVCAYQLIERPHSLHTFVFAGWPWGPQPLGLRTWNMNVQQVKAACMLWCRRKVPASTPCIIFAPSRPEIRTLWGRPLEGASAIFASAEAESSCFSCPSDAGAAFASGSTGNVTSCAPACCGPKMRAKNVSRPRVAPVVLLILVGYPLLSHCAACLPLWADTYLLCGLLLL